MGNIMSVSIAIEDNENTNFIEQSSELTSMGNILSGRMGDNEKAKINEYWMKLYENEIKFKRPDTEVESIKAAVNEIFTKLMFAVGQEEPFYEIFNQYLVGSMAEGTSIGEPNELDYLVLMKHLIEFQKRGILTHTSTHKYVFTIGDENKYIKTNSNFWPEILRKVLATHSGPFQVETDHGIMSIQSTTVCHHGPASVVKLLWKPTYEDSKPLDILIDITPCIEKQGIGYSLDYMSDQFLDALILDNKHLLIPIFNGRFHPAFTMTEVGLVKGLSDHHKRLYMILKYYLNNILRTHYTFCSLTSTSQLFSSFYIKSLVMFHAYECTPPVHKECLFTCLLDILSALRSKQCRYCPCSRFDDPIIFFAMNHDKTKILSTNTKLKIALEDTIKKTVQIVQSGKPNDFKIACDRESKHPAVRRRAEILRRRRVECHLDMKCSEHDIYLKRYTWMYPLYDITLSKKRICLASLTAFILCVTSICLIVFLALRD